MPLKKLKVKTNPAAATLKKGQAPIISIEGELIKQYNDASAQAKAAVSVMEELRPEIMELGLDEVFARSMDNPLDPVLTVKLQDEKEEVLRVQFTSKYGKAADVDRVEEVFEQLGADINKYVQEVVVAKFDCSVLYDAEGTFDQKRFDAFRTAIERVSKTMGIDCPLKSDKAVVVKDSFHADRFTDFKTVDDQRLLTSVLPNTTQLVPVTVKVPVAA